MPFPPYPENPTEPILKSLISEIFQLPESCQLPAVRDFLIGTVNACELGKIGRETACYFMAELMFLGTVEADQRYSDVCLVAGKLELPDRYAGNGVQSLWQDLAASIRDLPRLG